MAGLFSELKRRNVVRVGVAYLVMGWVIMQIVDVLAQTLVLPDWFAKTVLAILLVGLPLALFFSWAYELTPQGVKKTEEVDSDASITPSTGRKLDRVIIVALVVALGYFVWERQTGESIIGFSGEAADKSIAVLPFADLSPEGDQEYFADGIAEEILNVLTQSPDLKVAGRTSSFSFKGQNLNLKVIGERLGVAYILEGSIRKSGNRIRITAQLVSAEDGFHLWSQTYRRDLSDIFAVQDEISRAIVEALQVEMAFGELIVGSAEGPDIEAYSLYLRGRQSLMKRSESDLLDAIRFFDVVIMLDPDFADAYAAKAMAHTLVAAYGSNWKSNVEGLATSKQAIDRALEINPDNSEALLARGITMLFLGRDWSAAKAALERALEIAPNNSEILNFMGDYWIRIGNVEAAIEYDRRASVLDPLRIGNIFDLGTDMFHLGRYDEALKYADEAEAAAPNVYAGGFLRAMVLFAQSRYDDLEAMIEGLPPVAENFIIPTGEYRARLLLVTGRREEAAPLLEKLEQAVASGAASPARLAGLYLIAGNEARAAELLELAYEGRDTFLTFFDLIILQPQYRDHPVVRALLEKPELKELHDMRLAYAQWPEYRSE